MFCGTPTAYRHLSECLEFRHSAQEMDTTEAKPEHQLSFLAERATALGSDQSVASLEPFHRFSRRDNPIISLAAIRRRRVCQRQRIRIAQREINGVNVCP